MRGYTRPAVRNSVPAALIMMQRFGHETQRMQVMRRMGVYKPTDFEPYRDLVIDPADVKIACKTK
ncbi:hypothetical protein D9M69_500790 [compost metagenome]